MLWFTGAFLIPFTVMLVIAGLPLMFMELSFGQYAALGPIAVYQRFCPLLKGLGYGMIIVSAIVMLYYNVIISWTIFYIFASIRAQLPWQNCDSDWSTQCKYFKNSFLNLKRIWEICLTKLFKYKKCHSTYMWLRVIHISSHSTFPYDKHTKSSTSPVKIPLFC